MSIKREQSQGTPATNKQGTPAKNKFEKINTAAIRVVVFIVAICTIVFAIIQFSLSNNERISHLNASQVKDNTERISRQVDNMLADRRANIKILSEFYSKSLTSSEVDVKLLQQMTEDSNFDFMEFADKAGNDHTIA